METHYYIFQVVVTGGNKIEHIYIFKRPYQLNDPFTCLFGENSTALHYFDAQIGIVNVLCIYNMFPQQP